MSDTNITVHLSEQRKNLLDALVAHSEHSGHGAQSEYIRQLIDETAAAHDDIDFDSPDIPTGEDEFMYDPYEFDSILSSEQVHEVLNTEQSPAINFHHVPRTWTPNRRVDTAAVIAAVYRFALYDVGDKASVEVCIKRIVGRGVKENLVKEYMGLVRDDLDIYGLEPTNIEGTDGDYDDIDLEDIEVESDSDEVDVDELADNVEKLVERFESEGGNVEKGEVLELHNQVTDKIETGVDMDDELVALNSVLGGLDDEEDSLVERVPQNASYGDIMGDNDTPDQCVADVDGERCDNSALSTEQWCNHHMAQISRSERDNPVRFDADEE